MPGKKRTAFQIAADLGNAAIDKLSDMERHWKHLNEDQRAKIVEPVKQAVSRLEDLNNRNRRIDTSEDVSV